MARQVAADEVPRTAERVRSDLGSEHQCAPLGNGDLTVRTAKLRFAVEQHLPIRWAADEPRGLVDPASWSRFADARGGLAAAHTSRRRVGVECRAHRAAPLGRVLAACPPVGARVLNARVAAQSRAEHRAAAPVPALLPRRAALRAALRLTRRTGRRTYRSLGAAELPSGTAVGVNPRDAARRPGRTARNLKVSDRVPSTDATCGIGRAASDVLARGPGALPEVRRTAGRSADPSRKRSCRSRTRKRQHGRDGARKKAQRAAARHRLGKPTSKVVQRRGARHEPG